MKSDVIIIGGGAAGLTAALSASGRGASVTVLEAAPRVGRKILASGNGRCNLANTVPAEYAGGGGFAARVLDRCPADRVLAFFRGLGLLTAQEDAGRVYPACGQASAVLDVLRSALDRQGVRVLCDCPANRIEPKKDGGFRVHTHQGAMDARAVVAACGGMAGGRLGHDGGAYRLLTDLGHALIPTMPALSPLTAEKSAVKGLAGLRLPAILTLCRKKDGLTARDARRRDMPIFRPCQGEALFTDYGVSGICAMELCRRTGEEFAESGAWPVLYLDFSPMLGLVPRRYGWLEGDPRPERNLDAVRALLKKRAETLPPDDLLTGLAPRVLAERLKGQSIPDLARNLAAYAVPLTGVRGFDYAQVTAGGVSAAEFDPETLESLRVPNLFAAGEMLDVDGPCGGYNLLFAFASGLLAGESAARAQNSSAVL